MCSPSRGTIKPRNTQRGICKDKRYVLVLELFKNMKNAIHVFCRKNITTHYNRSRHFTTDYSEKISALLLA